LATITLGYLTSRISWLNKNLFTRLLAWVGIIAIGATISSSVALTKSDCQRGDATWYSILFSAILFAAIILIVFQLWLWFRSSRRYVSNVLAKSERTQYQYSQLKRQLNPHFLFNSLSILDYLVQEQQTERASDYIKKLANIYRYLLKQEEYDTIELSKEVDFLRLYIDIMRERFLDSFEVEIDIPNERLSRKVVPCSLQVLVENAFKHNAVSPTNKLVIEIASKDNHIEVCNNLNPKQIPSESNGFGLKNLKAQYKVLSGSDIDVVEDAEHFIVKIPIL
jgi:LytS/YehU family sensor histidine kinase